MVLESVGTNIHQLEGANRDLSGLCDNMAAMDLEGSAHNMDAVDNWENLIVITPTDDDISPFWDDPFDKHY